MKKKYIKPSLDVVVTQFGTLLQSSIEQTEQLSKELGGSFDWDEEESRDTWSEQWSAWDE